MKIVNTDNFGGDYPDERFVTGIPTLIDSVEASIIADTINKVAGPNSKRFWKVVQDDYELHPGFEP
jgi:hypothetical protein